MFENKCNSCMENISIVGITPLEYYPCCKNIIAVKQNMENINVLIPSQKPDIESIEEIKISICITNSKVIDTILGKKAIISGVFKVKVIYTANNCEQSVHSAHWDIPFYDFILLEDICCCHELNKLELFVGVEDVCINYNDLRRINLSTLYIICTYIDRD